MQSQLQPRGIGILALSEVGEVLPLQVLESGAGFYIGTADGEGPVSRESVEYWPSRKLASQALDQRNWTQKTRSF